MLVSELKRAGKGIIVISHDKNLLEKTTDDILYLDKNRQYSLINSDLFFNSSDSNELFCLNILDKEKSL